MKILTFTSLFPNRAKPNHGIFVFQRMQHLAHRAGNCVKVVAPITYLPNILKNDPQRGWVTQVPRQEFRGDLGTFHPRYFLLPHLMPAHGTLMFMGAYREVVRLHKRDCFDCIDAHYIYPDGFAAALLAERLNLPLFLSARGTDINLFPSFRTIRSLIQWSLRKAAGLIAVSEGLRERMIQLGADPARVKVVGNGVDVQRFYPVPRQEARSRLGVPSEAQMVVCVAGLVPAKGHLPLIEAVAAL